MTNQSIYAILGLSKRWEAWYYDYINGNNKTYIYVEADSFDEAIAKARRIDLRVNAARVVSE